ncbi:hypothetical protein [Hymenobacter chitinivorans]|uniref:Uncharacterized protein n=1 Tax=Hymenobacter chitinivorans DSM 11115 TaxID=1121954 RepID=A0A2M9BP94_9BACT|nr:hypothetical protein [Hymenobacter chitinivorans]PJJ59764.1 hypothetical protein CLV45_1186 [Hymenobacter chitinivorans DSM 11115]
MCFTFRVALLLLAGIILSLAGSSAVAQSAAVVLVNGKEFDLEKCQKLSRFRTISLPVAANDSSHVELYLIRGRRPFGRNYFESVAEFNSYDLRAWLRLEKPTNAVYIREHGAIAPVTPARPGDRLLILLGKEANLADSKFAKAYNLQLCAD